MLFAHITCHIYIYTDKTSLLCMYVLYRYTERMLAVVLYTTTELYLLTDVSEDFSDTR